MLGDLDRPLVLSPSAQLGTSIFVMPQPAQGTAELDQLRDLTARVVWLEQQGHAFEAWRVAQAQREAQRWIVRLRRWSQQRGQVMREQIARLWSWLVERQRNGD